MNDTPALGRDADAATENLELKILEMQQHLDDQQTRMDETFGELVVVTRELHESMREKTRLEERLQQNKATLREQQTRIGSLVATLEQREQTHQRQVIELDKNETGYQDNLKQLEAHHAEVLEQRDQAYQRLVAEADQRATGHQENLKQLKEHHARELSEQRQREEQAKSRVEQVERRAVEALDRERAQNALVQRQNQDLGKLIALLERYQRKEQLSTVPAPEKMSAWQKMSGAWLNKLSKKRRQRALVARQVAQLEASSLFDAQWYLNEYPDVAADSRMAQNPARHYLLIGGFEGRNPCPAFDSAFYIAYYEDVRSSGVNPLLHYLKFGMNEERRTQAE